MGSLEQFDIHLDTSNLIKKTERNFPSLHCVHDIWNNQAPAYTSLLSAIPILYIE